MAGSTENSDGDVGFQIAPMIDLILVLLVFFMSTVALKQVENELGIQLPGGMRESKPFPQVIAPMEEVVAIDADGSITLNNEPAGSAQDRELPGLRDKLKAQRVFFGEKTYVVIVPHLDVSHARVVDVLNVCSASGIKNISFGGG